MGSIGLRNGILSAGLHRHSLKYNACPPCDMQLVL